MKNFFAFSPVLLLIPFFSFTQLQTPDASPRAKVFQKVGLVEIILDYSRPSKKGREIYGGLVPFNKIWRTGANSPTTISFSDDIKINNELISKGEYHLYSVPSQSSFDLVIYEKTNAWGSLSEFDESLIKARLTSELNDLPFSVETFTISIANITNSGSSLNIIWDNKIAVFTIDVLTKNKMIQNINTVLSENPTENDYRKAAVYYYEENIDMKMAVKWIDKAYKDSDDLKYWQLRYKALIYEKAGKIKKAREYAKLGYSKARTNNIPDGINSLEIIVDRLSIN